MEPLEQSDLFTMRQVAAGKGVSYHTVSRAVRSGLLPARRLGQQALIAATDLEDWAPQIARRPSRYRGRSANPTIQPTFRRAAAAPGAPPDDETRQLLTRFAALGLDERAKVLAYIGRLQQQTAVD